MKKETKLKQTYDNYYRKYYLENKEKLAWKNRKAKKLRNKEYYQKNKKEILEKRRLNRLKKSGSVEE